MKDDTSCTRVAGYITVYRVQYSYVPTLKPQGVPSAAA